jgi:hypothetical protein
MSSVIKSRHFDSSEEIGAFNSPSPLDTVKIPISLPPGMTEPVELPSDFKLKPIFPLQREASFADLKAITKEYYLFNHCLWFSYAGLPVDPLLEFYMRDGASKKSVVVFPLAKTALFNVSPDASFSYMGKMLFGVPKDRGRDLFHWMDGVGCSEAGSLLWMNRRQNLPLTFGAPFEEYNGSEEYISLWGFQTRTHMIGYLHHSEGKYIAASKALEKDHLHAVEKNIQAKKDAEARAKKLIVD